VLLALVFLAFDLKIKVFADDTIFVMPSI